MAVPPPSPFAALLRRSKFASFDPKIGQVYTSYDGYAARGNFGLKRPLAIRRRNAFVVVKSVDSREMQTEWHTGEKQNRWIRMWDELGIKPQLTHGHWSNKLGAFGSEFSWVVDSEFTTATGTPSKKAEEDAIKEARRSQLTINFEAMSNTEFERFLAKLRKLRPAFHKFLAEKSSRSDWADASMFEHSHIAGEEFVRFLESVAYQEYHSARPRFIEPHPHRFAGLNYTHASSLQTLLTTKPHIGRVLGDGRAGPAQAASAGMVHTLPKGHRGNDQKTVTSFRVTAASLFQAPNTVGEKPEGLVRTWVPTSVMEDREGLSYRKENPHAPGSREYVGFRKAFVPTTSHGMMARAPVVTRVEEFDTPSGRMAGKALLTSLNTLVSRPSFDGSGPGGQEPL